MSQACFPISVNLSNPSAGPDSSHNAWLAEKEAAGWKYGPVKDAEYKEHPCFVPYDELPVEQRAKEDARLLRLELIKIAVDDLGMDQAEANKADIVTFLDGYLCCQGHHQRWRNIAAA